MIPGYVKGEGNTSPDLSRYQALVSLVCCTFMSSASLSVMDF